MLQITAFEKYYFTIRWRNIQAVIFLKYPQLSSIFCFPAIVEVHDHGEFPAVIILELVQMPFIGATYWIQRIMKFIPVNSRVTGAIQVNDELIHQIKKSILKFVLMFAVKPVDLVRPE